MIQVINHIIMQDGTARIVGKEHVKAEMVARMYVGTGYSIEDVMEQYHLTMSEVHAALAYYYDNQAELDARLATILAEVGDNAMTMEKFRAKIAARKASEQAE